jgi:hypothetical protein
MAGDGFYQPWQLEGPYQMPRDEFVIDRIPVLYPPYAILLLLPFALVPILAPLWWIVPIAITLAVVAHFRPRPWTWPFLTLSVLSADTMWLAISGNPVMWATAFLALGTMWGWPSVGVLVKPSLAPFALVGVRTRGWWVAIALLALVSVPFLALWRDFAVALSNERGVGLLYSANNIPMLLIPLLAWWGRGDGDHRADRSERSQTTSRSGSDEGREVEVREADESSHEAAESRGLKEG